MSGYVYHYTNESGKNGIIRAKKIKKSKLPGAGGRARDARYGEGVYLTAMSPEVGYQKLVQNNFDDARTISPSGLAKVRFYFKIAKNDLKPELVNVEESPRDVYLYPGDIDLNSVPYTVGETA